MRFSPYLNYLTGILGLGILLAAFGCNSPQPSTAFSGTSTPLPVYQHPIPFAPRTYVCYQTPNPIKVDGKLDESIWNKTPDTEDFTDIEGTLKPKPTFKTNVKMLWDDDYFYFGAMLVEPHIWATLTERDAVIFYDDDFEIFIDPDGDTHHYYEFEMNALNTVWDLLLISPYREKRGPHALNGWDIAGLKSAVHVEGTLNDPSDEDQFWSVEVAIPWEILKEMAKGPIPKDSEQWRVGFSRVDWTMDIKEGKYQKRLDAATGKPLPENNWVWSPTGFINMHMPEQWGYVQFSSQVAGSGDVAFVPNHDEAVKWNLRQVHYQQLKYFDKNEKYAGDLSLLSIPSEWGISLYSTPSGYEAIAKSIDGKGQWIIRENGRILKH